MAVRVDNRVNYTIVEDTGAVNITLLLDQPSCRLITINARPQETSPTSATGNLHYLETRNITMYTCTCINFHDIFHSSG